jgi:hypothetical protein
MRSFLTMAIQGAVLAAVLGGSGPALSAGAIAIDDEEGMKAADVGYGIGTGPSRDAAAVDAMRECRLAGNTACKVVVRYDLCGAYATSRSYAGIGWGESEEQAKRAALKDCGNASCRIVVSDCDNE